METILETKTDVLILNNEPEFVAWSADKVSANFFILCEDSDPNLSKNICEYEICGKAILEWVQRACLSKPVVLRCGAQSDVLSCIKPYISGAEYSVVLFSNTPLVSSRHIADALAFAKRKHMGVCKLKRGYIFKNEYIQKVDQIFSVDTYDFESDDFFEVNSLAQIEEAREVLQKRIFDFHRSENVIFSNPASVNIDADVQIGEMSKIGGNTSILERTKIGLNNDIGENVVIRNSKLADDIIVKDGAIIDGAVIKNGAVIGTGAIVKASVIGENVSVGDGSKVLSSAVKNGVQIGSLVNMIGARLGENQEVKSGITILADKSQKIENLASPAKPEAVKFEKIQMAQDAYQNHYDDEDVSEFKNEKYGLVLEEDLDSDRIQPQKSSGARSSRQSQPQEVFEFDPEVSEDGEAEDFDEVDLDSEADDFDEEPYQEDFDAQDDFEADDFNDEDLFEPINRYGQASSVEANEELQEETESQKKTQNQNDFVPQFDKVLPRDYVSFSETETKPNYEGGKFYYELREDEKEKLKQAEQTASEPLSNFGAQEADEDESEVDNAFDAQEAESNEEDFEANETAENYSEIDDDPVEDYSETQSDDELAENYSETEDDDSAENYSETDEDEPTENYSETDDDDKLDENENYSDDDEPELDLSDIGSLSNLSADKYKSDDDNEKYGKYYENYKFSNYDINLDDKD